MTPPNINYWDLPEPEGIYWINSAKFEVFKVKDLYSGFTDNELTRILKLSRGAYLVYGHRPEIDQYDQKAAIYLVRVSYTAKIEDNEYLEEEWISLRFVPGSGNPYGTGDLELFAYDNTPLSKIFHRKFSSEYPKYMDSVISSSRLCGIVPVTKSALPGMAINQSRHSHTGVCFALINKHFWQDCVAKNIPYRFLAGIIYERVIQKSLTVAAGNVNYAPAFTHAHIFLGLNSKVKVNREKYPHYVYKYPGYFLDMNQVVETVRQLLLNGILTISSLQYYLGILSVEELSAKNKSVISGMGKMLWGKGKLYRAHITREELRNVINENVQDGPSLFITDVGERIISVNQMLNALK